MTKNITAVLFALLLSTAVFAQYPIISTTGTMPGIPQGYTGMSSSASPSSSNINEDVLEARNTTAAAFNGYSQANSIPDKAKTFAHIKYNAAAGYRGLGAIGTSGGGWPMPSWQHMDVPAVFVKDHRPSVFMIAVPALELQKVPQEFEYFVSLSIVANTESNTKTYSSNPSKTKCPSDLHYRQAANSQEADICYKAFNASNWFAGQLKSEVFSKKSVTLSLAAKALKK